MTEAVSPPMHKAIGEPSQKDAYLAHLKDIATSDGHFYSITKHFRRGLEYWKRLRADGDPYYLYQEDSDEVEKLMLEDGYTRKYAHTCVQELRHYCNFVLESIGADPRFPRRQGLWKVDLARDGCMFEKDLPGYAEYLRAKGLRETTIVAKTVYARNGLKMVYETTGSTNPFDIDCEVISKIRGKYTFPSEGKRNSVLSAVGDFVEYKTGYNPTQELRRNSWSLDFVPKTPQEVSFLEDLGRFIADLRERGFRERSLQKRAMSTAIPYRFITEMHGPVYLKDIDYHMFREAARSMSHLKQITIQGYLGLLGQLIEFCYGHNPNREAGIVYSKQPVDRIFINEAQWRVLFAEATLTERTILALAAGMGLRRSEIAYIHLSDIDGDMLTVYGKGTGSYGKVTKMQIPDYVQEIIGEYMRYRARLINPVRDRSEGRLLVNDRYYVGTPMGEYVVSHLVTELGDRAGVKVSCHVFRRLYCMTMFESGIEDDTIRRMMRHSYFSTTSDHYLSADPKRLDRAKRSVGGLFA